MKTRVLYIMFLCMLSLVAWNIGKTRNTGGKPNILNTFEHENQPTPTPFPELSFEQIFSDDHSWIDSLPQEEIITVIATGDVLTALMVNQKMVASNNFRWPFEKTKEMLEQADIAVINLETPLLSDCKPTHTGMIFCGSDRVVEGFLFAGIDVATLGNNHMGNYYLFGVEETKKILAGAGISFVADEVMVKVVRSTSVAFLSYNDIGVPEPGVPWADDEKIIEDIRRAKEQADIVIVAAHWGEEYVTMPNTRQRQLAHLMIDSGADLVIGNHPHWIQPVEIYKGSLIMYSHGNFVFDQEWSEETKTGVVGRYTFFGTRLVDVEFVPIRIVDYGQPYVLEGDHRSLVLNALRTVTHTLEGQK